MSLSLIDSSYYLPLALKQTILADKALVFSLALKDIHLKVQIFPGQIFEIAFETRIGYPLPAVLKRQIHNIIFIIIPVKNTIIKILN